MDLPSDEQLAALEATATMATSAAFTTSRPRDSVVAAANARLGESFGLSLGRTGKAGTVVVGEHGFLLSRVFVRMVLTAEGARLYVQMTGLVHERIPLFVSAMVVGLAGATVTFGACFQLGVGPELAAVLFVGALIALCLGWLRVRSTTNDRTTQELHRALALVAADLGAGP